MKPLISLKNSWGDYRSKTLLRPPPIELNENKHEANTTTRCISPSPSSSSSPPPQRNAIVDSATPSPTGNILISLVARCSLIALIFAAERGSLAGNPSPPSPLPISSSSPLPRDLIYQFVSAFVDSCISTPLPLPPPVSAYRCSWRPLLRGVSQLFSVCVR